jgi:cytochrome d ubiquinol oxidase subunit I
MQNAAVLSVALLMAGIAAYYIRRNRPEDDDRFWRATLKIALVALLITAPLQVVHGDAYARHVSVTQPQKFAAMEAVWDTASYVPEYIVAFPTSLNDVLNPRAKNVFGIGIPGGASWLASGGDAQAQIAGLNEFEGSPPVAVVFWSFRLMVAMGF